MSEGVATPDIPTAALVAEVLANREVTAGVKETVRQSISDHAAQLLAAPAFDAYRIAIEEAAAHAVPLGAASWTVLNLLEGSFIGQQGQVGADDVGTHTDPVVGGTVDNAGIYSWNGTAWRRINDLAPMAMATSGEVVTGTVTDKAVSPAGDKAALDARFGPTGSVMEVDGEEVYALGERVISGLKAGDGSVSAFITEDGRAVLPQPDLRGFTGFDHIEETANYVFRSVPIDGRAQILRTAKSTGVDTQVTSLGSNGRPRISSDGAHLLYESDRFGGRVGMFQPVAGGAEYRIFPLAKILCPGDSLTNGSGVTGPPNAYPRKLAAETGCETRNAGNSGETSTQIAARMGAVPITVTVTGGDIPTSGYAVLTGVTPAMDGTIPGTLAGVSGVMSYVSGANRFTPTVYPGAPVAVAPGSVFTPDLEGRDSWIWAIWAGRNNYNAGATVKADIAAMIGVMKPLIKRYVVMSILNDASSEYSGTAGHTTIMALNADLAALYPGRYLDVRSWLISHGLAAVGITPTSPDLIDIAADVVPDSLRSDTLHLNDAGYLAVAICVAAFLASKGWLI